MEDVRPVDLENLFAFVYEGKITVKPNQSEGLLRAANQLKIDSLVKQLEKPSVKNNKVLNHHYNIARNNVLYAVSS